MTSVLCHTRSLNVNQHSVIVSAERSHACERKACMEGGRTRGMAAIEYLEGCIRVMLSSRAVVAEMNSRRQSKETDCRDRLTSINLESVSRSMQHSDGQQMAMDGL